MGWWDGPTPVTTADGAAFTSAQLGGSSGGGGRAESVRWNEEVPDSTLNTAV